MLLLIATITLVACNQSAKTSSPQEQTQQAQVNIDISNKTLQESKNTNTETTKSKKFHLNGINYAFVMNNEQAPDIMVNEGDLVTIEFESQEGFHDWVVDEFNAATEKVRPEDGMTTITFIADKKGTYEYYCSVGSHRAQGMFGNLIVQ
ncbi:multicopper oxidase domain-containing protein [Candidatus Woesearchaeota archaeon]|nr:multicopper oxidase domain-containing protein [Candidatus Woesearchaeota archaeon]